jgi:hypothetical protein
MNSPVTQLRIETTLAALREIELAVRRDSNAAGELDPKAQRHRISDAVRLYAAQVIADSQK